MLAGALSLTMYNVWEDRQAGESAEHILENMEVRQPEEALQPEEQPLYEKYPDMEMPVVEVDGNRYIGTISMPTLGKELPVVENLSEELLRIAPCRYKGSVYSDDMILAGHNYKKHFGGIRRLRIGDEVFFTDADGNRFDYEVNEIELIPGEGVEAMDAGDWDMTLFTCNLGGKSRITVRCSRIR